MPLRLYMHPLSSYCWKTLIAFYNAARPHSGLDGQTPDEAYFNQLQPIPAAA